MKILSISCCIILLVLNIACSSGKSEQEQIYNYNTDESLEVRVDKAVARAKAENLKEGFYVTYTIQMNYAGRNYFEGRFPFYIDDYDFSYIGDEMPTLKDLIAGRKDKTEFEEDREALKRAAERTLKDMDTPEDRTLLKRWYFWEGEEERSIIVQYNEFDKYSPERIRIMFLNQEFVDDGKPVFWIGKSSDNESIGFLNKLYDNCENYYIRRKIISAVALHETVSVAVPFLKEIISKEPYYELQEHAIISFGYFPGNETLEYLKNLFPKRHSHDYSEALLDAVAKNWSDKAVTFLKNVAVSENYDMRTRREAIDALGTIRSERAFSTLLDLTDLSNEADIQEEAIESISNFGDGESIPVLMLIAKSNPSLKIRETALEELADKKDSRIVNFFNKILF